MTFTRARLAVMLVAVFTVTLGLAGPAMAAKPLPYTDFSAQGSVGLCDQAGKPVTSGKITDKPFVWFAVSGMKAPEGYGGDGRKATLFIYQPRPNTYPTQWSADQMTSSSPYSNPDFPMAAASAADFSLADYIHEFPPMWDGLLQLRIYFGAPNKPTATDPYPATDIVVTGSTWHVVRGASVACTKGTAQPNEPGVVTAQPVSNPSSSTAQSSPATSASGTASTGSMQSSSPTSSGSEGSQILAAGSEAASTSSTSSSRRPLLLSLIVLAGLAGGGTWWYRRRSNNSTGAHS